MKACLLVFSAFIVMLVLMPTPVDARYCLHRAGSIGPGRCDFSTRQACMRIAAALPATCSRNSTTFHHSRSRVR
jgi:hypothetical protein